MPSLDQFFTKPSVAKECWDSLLPIVKETTGKSANRLHFIEPSAGTGVFYDLMPSGKRTGIDIEPRRREFINGDFLTYKHPRNSKARNLDSKDIVVVGNPPFGKRGDLAVKFLNKAASIGDTVAFIVPVIFRKFFIHKQIDPTLCWIQSLPLERGAFQTDKDETYEVNTEFQIWTRLDSVNPSMRLFSPPPIKHEDFEMHQYNNTKEALKVFKERFDFAVPSQGWQDYSRRESDARNCEKHKQWILFDVGGNKMVYERLYEGIDYEQLARKNTTTTPGFRKGDVIQEYMDLFGGGFPTGAAENKQADLMLRM